MQHTRQNNNAIQVKLSNKFRTSTDAQAS